MQHRNCYVLVASRLYLAPRITIYFCTVEEKSKVVNYYSLGRFFKSLLKKGFTFVTKML